MREDVSDDVNKEISNPNFWIFGEYFSKIDYSNLSLEINPEDILQMHSNMDDRWLSS